MKGHFLYKMLGFPLLSDTSQRSYQWEGMVHSVSVGFFIIQYN